MGKIRKTTPEEHERQLENQRRLEELIERLRSGRKRSAGSDQPPARA